jgi:hypothetical protein
MLAQFGGLISGRYDVVLRAGGSVTGSFGMNMMGEGIVMKVNGQWSYDYRQKLLTMNGVLEATPMAGPFGIPIAIPMPPQMFSAGWRVSEGGRNGRYTAFDTEQGQQWLIERAR